MQKKIVRKIFLVLQILYVLSQFQNSKKNQRTNIIIYRILPVVELTLIKFRRNVADGSENAACRASREDKRENEGG